MMADLKNYLDNGDCRKGRLELEKIDIYLKAFSIGFTQGKKPIVNLIKCEEDVIKVGGENETHESD
jgi:hypothetical protein